MKDKIKAVLKNEGMTWEKLAELEGLESKGGYRSTLIRRAERLQKTFDLLGYDVVFIKKK